LEFPSILSKLIARVKDEQLRFLLVGILYSELGSGEFESAHFMLFRKLLEQAGVHVANLQDVPTREATRNLISGLYQIYEHDPFLVALGAQYILEAQADNMLTQIRDGFAKLDRLKGRPLQFFVVHSVEEPKHISAMRDCINRAVAVGDTDLVSAGAKKCLDLFGNFWTAFDD
jgi:pyrroloquinoline quinone (PQQ) biosynthesis protein C